MKLAGFLVAFFLASALEGSAFSHKDLKEEYSIDPNNPLRLILTEKGFDFFLEKSKHTSLPFVPKFNSKKDVLPQEPVSHRWLSSNFIGLATIGIVNVYAQLVGLVLPNCSDRVCPENYQLTGENCLFINERSASSTFPIMVSSQEMRDEGCRRSFIFGLTALPVIGVVAVNFHFLYRYIQFKMTQKPLEDEEAPSLSAHERYFQNFREQKEKQENSSSFDIFEVQGSKEVICDFSSTEDRDVFIMTFLVSDFKPEFGIRST